MTIAAAVTSQVEPSASLLSQAGTFGYFFLAFTAVVFILVFIHEFGHFIVARWAGVKVECFSIGFGKELWGFNDKHGTRWKLCLIPFGGYVKMFGDIDPASSPDFDKLKALTAEEKSQTFFNKPLSKKAAIVIAGPAANYLLAIAIFTAFLMIFGIRVIPPVIGGMMEKGPAAEAGLTLKDRILKIDDQAVESFDNIREVISLNTGSPITITYERQGEQKQVTLTPKLMEMKNNLGMKFNQAVIGITPIPEPEYKKVDLNVFQAIGMATAECGKQTMMTLRVLGQIITGNRSIKEMGGVVTIAELSGRAAQQGIDVLIWYLAIISISLGFFNLLPIPMLDGGHLLFYFIEAVKGAPLAEKIQEGLMKVGMAFILLLAVVVTFNDVVRVITR